MSLHVTLPKNRKRGWKSRIGALNAARLGNEMPDDGLASEAMSKMARISLDLAPDETGSSALASASASSSAPNLAQSHCDPLSRTKLGLLSHDQLLERTRSLSVVVKMLRRRIRGLEGRMAKSEAKRSRILSESEAEVLTPSVREPICEAMRLLQDAETVGLPDHRHIFVNLATALASRKLSLLSLRFHVLCTQVRPDILTSGNMCGMRFVLRFFFSSVQLT